MTRDRFGEFHDYARYRTREDRDADEIRRRHEDPEADCIEDCPLCLEQNEPVSLCCGLPAVIGSDDICSFCYQHAMFKIPVKGF
jgi:hypothetical protein